MSAIDDVLLANQAFAKEFRASHFASVPRKQLVLLTCMDTRLTVRSLGLTDGDAHILRNAGGIITDDALRSLILSHYIFGTKEVMIVNHTDCGQMRLSEDELREHVIQKSGTDSEHPASFHAFEDPEANVREQLRRLRAHPWLSGRVTSRGFVYDVETGKLAEVVEPAASS